MRRKVITTNDGSSTLYMEDLGETYHSIHGAIQEANHVYILNGLERLLNQKKDMAQMKRNWFHFTKK